jgi:hypothetical protein
MYPTVHREIHVSGVVRARHDIPQVGVRCGERGVVQSRWFEPYTAFEVEFRRGKLELPLRVILDGCDLEAADDEADEENDAPLAPG